ncbi:MAG: beta-propeller domain-containing protein [Hyphomonadaceae bacterium]
MDPPVWRTISLFSSEAEFLNYLRDVRAAQRRARGVTPGKQQAEDCPPELYPCENGNDGADEAIMVTGSRIPSPARAAAAPQATSITNVQNAGVDEGDIVKLYGRFLIVLQDGRLFSVDTGEGAGEMRLVDRVNVYRRRNAGVWYDEILISDNRVVVTGYNYSENATEFSVFSIGRDGRFTRETVYFLSSNDYYDNENYATRLVNGNLVIYTPLFVGELSPDARPQWPLVRRWLSEDEHRATSTRGRNLFDATNIHRPIQATYDPVVHTISVCPLGTPRGGDELECDSTAIVAPPAREFYVSTEHIYLWTWPVHNQLYARVDVLDCEARRSDPFERAMPAALFQIPLAQGQMRAQFVRGQPYDQLSMDANGREFRALSVWHDARCPVAPREYEYDEEVDEGSLPLRYVSLPLSGFSTTPFALARSHYTPLPSVGAALENRFTDTHLVYAGRSTWSSYAPSPDSDVTLDSRVVAVPTRNPRAATIVTAPHSALRVERVGDNVIVTGYRDWRGLNISLVNLSGRPRISSSVFLAERYESEGRSHAFNAAIDPDGSGLMGLPTVMRRAQSGRWWWRSAASDVSYVALDARGDLSSVGALRGASPRNSAYQCEVSCIDWYGNTRALFIASRVFALAGTELIEGRITEDGIADLARVNLTDPVPGARS